MSEDIETQAAAEDERSSLFREYARTRAPELRDRLVEMNLGLAYSFAGEMKKRYPGFSLADLQQEASVGLLEAVDRFDPDRGVRFSTYASIWIKAYLRAFVRSQMPLSQRSQDQFARIARAAAELQQELKREATDEEIAARLGDTDAETVSALRMASRRQISLDQLDDDASSASASEPLAERIPDATQDTERFGSAIIDGGIFETAMSKLTEREQMALRMRFGMDPYERPYSLVEIGHQLGVTKQRAYQLIQRAMDRLKSFMEGASDERGADEGR